MSDYLGALIRSAGFGAEPVRRAAPQPPDDDPFEQAAQHAAPERAAPAPLDAAAGHVPSGALAGSRVAAPADLPSAEPRRASIQPAPAATDPHSKVRPRAVETSPTAAAAAAACAAVGGAALHPVVRAALRWVAADPALRRSPAHAQPPHAADPALLPTRPNRDAAEQPMRSAPTASAPASAPIAAAPRPAVAAADPRPAINDAGPRAVAVPHESPSVRFEGPVRPASAASPAAPRPAPEVHIGSIHVTVDAPRPAPAPPAPARPASAARSAYLRSRAPRI